ncbi:DNA/RNA helicase domain-containing protein [Microbacterium sp. K24]|uniref:DNA/RNA helicase domain-containing protein n=1 Tax=Microbacterium sp. K24 TaxID=2305446 RepID=UPI001F0E1127|nr:DNA/RNA helicase domain-containing protein [Microbacterium sp. K24]
MQGYDLNYTGVIIGPDLRLHLATGDRRPARIARAIATRRQGEHRAPEGCVRGR